MIESTAKASFATLCKSEPSISLFLQPWWLDATCGSDNWDVALVKSGGAIQAALPYRKSRKFIFKTLSQPPLTPFLGPWLRDTDSKRAVAYRRQKELMIALIEALPPFDHYVQTWNPNVTNWLPFYWSGFEQTTYYTYVLNDLSDANRLWSGIRSNVRGDIKKAEGRFGIIVVDGTIDEMLELSQRTFERQGRKAPFGDEYLRKIDDACARRDCRKILVAKDQEGRLHAGAYIVWDDFSAYYLVGGGDPELRSSGATSLCIWKAIQFTSTVSNRFDFEGSIIEPIERFFRAFGAVQSPYFKVQRTQSKLLAWLLFLKSLRTGP